MNSAWIDRLTTPATSWAMSLGKALAVLSVGLLLASCGQHSNPDGSVSAVIDQSGGTLNGPDGLQVVVPAGALTAPTTIKVTPKPANAPSLAGTRAQAAVYEITPHGQQFLLPVTVRYPAPAGIDQANPQVLIAPLGGDWVRTLAVINNGMVEVKRMTFSFFGYSGILTCSSVDTAIDPYYCDLQGITVPTVTANAVTLGTPFGVSLSDNTAFSMDVLLLGAPDCANGVLQLTRSRFATTPPYALLGKTVTSVGVAIPADQNRVHVTIGNPSDANYQITAADNGRVQFDLAYTCQRPSWTRPQTVSGSFNWQVNITQPAPQAVALQATDPQDVTVDEGVPATFTVTPIGTGPFSYQWKRNGTAIVGATSQSYTIANPTVAADSGAFFSVDVSSPWGTMHTVTSRDALLTVKSQGQVSPISVAVNAESGADIALIIPTFPGTNRVYKAVATGGNPPYSYQWTLNGQPLPATTTLATTVGGCDIASLDYTEQGSRIYLNQYGTNCANAVPVDVGVTVTDALNNTGNGVVFQRMSAVPEPPEHWQVREVSSFDQFLDPAGISGGPGAPFVFLENAITDSQGHMAIAVPIDGVTANLYRYSATQVPALVPGVVMAAGEMTVDATDNVVFNTYPNNVLYKVGSTGAPTLFAGKPNPLTGDQTLPSDGLATTVATFSSPYKLVAAPNGDVFVLEWWSLLAGGDVSLVRRISGGSVQTLVNNSGQTHYRDMAIDVSQNLPTLYLLFVNQTADTESIYTLASNAALGTTPTLLSTWKLSDYPVTRIAAGDGQLFASDGSLLAWTIDPTTGGLKAIGGQGTANGLIEGPASTARFDQLASFTYDATGHALLLTSRGRVLRLYSMP